MSDVHQLMYEALARAIKDIKQKKDKYVVEPHDVQKAWRALEISIDVADYCCMIMAGGATEPEENDPPEGYQVYKVTDFNTVRNVVVAALSPQTIWADHSASNLYVGTPEPEGTDYDYLLPRDNAKLTAWLQSFKDFP